MRTHPLLPYVHGHRAVAFKAVKLLKSSWMAGDGLCITHSESWDERMQGSVILVRQKDQPGIIAGVSRILGEADVNISFMTVHAPCLPSILSASANLLWPQDLYAGYLNCSCVLENANACLHGGDTPAPKHSVSAMHARRSHRIIGNWSLARSRSPAL